MDACPDLNQFDEMNHNEDWLGKLSTCIQMVLTASFMTTNVGDAPNGQQRTEEVPHPAAAIRDKESTMEAAK